MPKAKNIDRWVTHLGVVLAYALWGGGWALAQNQPPSLNDVVDSAKRAKAQEHTKSLNDAYRPTAENRASAPTGPNAPPSPPMMNLPPPPPSIAPPMLRGIYGVNHRMQAEVVYNGRVYAVRSDDPRVDIGHWRYGVVSLSGVHLFRQALKPDQLVQVMSWTENGNSAVMGCEVLGLAKTRCLHLPVIPGSAETAEGPRSTSFSSSFPPFPSTPTRSSP